MALIDTHVHTRHYSLCAMQSLAEAVEAAAAAGLDGFCLTEHHHRWADDDIAEVQRAVGRDDIAVIPGQEISCVGPDGHAQGDYLVFGCRETLPARRPVHEIIAAAHTEGALVIAAHPLRLGMGAGDLVHHLPDLDGIEVYNQNHTQAECERVARIAEQLGLIPTAGSDAHTVGQMGQFAMAFATPVRNERELIAALRARAFDLRQNPDRAFRWAAG